MKPSTQGLYHTQTTLSQCVINMGDLFLGLKGGDLNGGTLGRWPLQPFSGVNTDGGCDGRSKYSTPVTILLHKTLAVFLVDIYHSKAQ
jgi:hypothetical protein